MITQKPAIVMDNGSNQFKDGISGADASRCFFPAVVGRYKMPVLLVGVNSKDTFISHEALLMQGILNIRQPIEDGIIKNWNDMERIWQHAIFDELRVAPDEPPFLLTEAPMNPKANREKMANIMFESFDVPSFHVSIQPVLSLYSSGRTTGLVLDSGYGVTHTVSIFEGYSLAQATLRIDVAGRACTDWLIKIIGELGMCFTTTAEREIVRDIKEKVAYVALDYDQEILKYKQSAKDFTPYELPDGNILTIQDQRFRCTELLFKPFNCIGMQALGIHELVFKSIMKCDIDLRRNLYNNIFMSGGTTMFRGLSERLSKEVAALAPMLMKIKVIVPQETKFTVLIGGQILSSLSSFQGMWITRAEYEDFGSAIVHRKCF